MKPRTGTNKIQEIIQDSIFTHVEVAAVNECNGNIQVTFDKNEVSFYSTYLCNKFATWIGDHDTLEEAMKYAQLVAKEFNLQIVNKTQHVE